MALTYLLDTSVLTRLSKPLVRAVVEPMILAGEVARSSISDLEIGSQARNADEWDQMAQALTVMIRVATTEKQVSRALDVQRMLAERSQRGRKIPDLLIAATAEAHRLTVLHYDADFDLIASVTGQIVQWMVPAGEAD